MRPRIPLQPDDVLSDGTPDGARLSPELTEAFERAYAATLACHELDALTVELVRLRNATFQGCHT